MSSRSDNETLILYPRSLVDENNKKKGAKKPGKEKDEMTERTLESCSDEDNQTEIGFLHKEEEKHYLIHGVLGNHTACRQMSENALRGAPLPWWQASRRTTPTGSIVALWSTRQLDCWSGLPSGTPLSSSPAGRPHLPPLRISIGVASPATSTASFGLDSQPRCFEGLLPCFPIHLPHIGSITISTLLRRDV